MSPYHYTEKTQRASCLHLQSTRHASWWSSCGVTVPGGALGSLLWVSHTLAEVTMGWDWGWMGWRKATVGKGTDWTWVMEESDREFGTPAWLLSLKLEGILHRGNGEGDTSSLEEPGTLGGLRDCSGVDEDLGRRCRMEEKKEQDSGRGMVPIPLSNVRILQPKPAAQGEQLKWLRVEGKRGSTEEWNNRVTMVEVALKKTFLNIRTREKAENKLCLVLC